MPEQPKDVADSMPVRGEAARHNAPASGPVATSETLEARKAQEQDDARRARARTAEVEDDGEDVEAADPTGQLGFQRRHASAMRRHARMMDKQLELRQAVRGPGEEPRVLRTMDQPKDNENYTKTELAIANNRDLTNEALRQGVGDETRLAEMQRAYGDYPGRVFTVDPSDLNGIKSLEVRGPDEPDVVVAFPQGLSSRHVPESRPR